MGLFKNKSCPACGGKLGILSFRVADGVKICSACETMLRGSYNITIRGAGHYDELQSLDIGKAKDIIEAMKKEQSRDIAELSGRYGSIMTVTEVFTVPKEGLDEGGGEIAALGGRCAVRGFCEAGSFSKNDRVLLLGGGGEREARILALVPCRGVYSFETALIAGAHKDTVEANSNAWLATDIDRGEVHAGDRIVRV